MYDFKKMGLLPYQIDYITNKSQIKLVEKSRQVGITRTQALEDVIDAGVEGLYDVYFSSNNDLNAREYINYCKKFAKTFELIVKDLTQTEFIEDEGNYCIEFKNGKRIFGVSSSPEQLHGKSGKIVLDEFARRKDQAEVWEAASPAALVWQKPLRIISTHNGKNSMFYQFIKQIEAKNLRWYHQKITIQDAVKQGLADKVRDKKLSPKERQEYIENLKKQVNNPTIWAQQFMCEPKDEAHTFLPYHLLQQVSIAELLKFNDLNTCKSLYAGLDVGRVNNLSVLWIIEAVSYTHFITRTVLPIKGTDFPKQEQLISQYLNLPNLRRLCIDATGMGIGLVDYLQKRHGTSRVEGITLTQPNKEKMAFALQKMITDKALELPNDQNIMDDFNSIKQDVTNTGKIRLSADTNEDTGSHADYFWACCLTLEAYGNTGYVKPEIFVPKPHQLQRASKLLKGFLKL